MDDEPRRWMDDPSVNAGLRDDLARASEVVPPIDVSAGLARLNETIRGGNGGGGGAGGSGGAAGWIAGAVIVVVIGGAALFSVFGDSERRVERAPAQEESSGEAVATREGMPPDALTGLDLEPATLATTDDARGDAPAVASGDAPRAMPPAHARRGSPAPRATRLPPVRTETSEVDPLREEMALLARTRAALTTDPGRALALADEGQRRFPEGLFGEEREAIAVLASSALGRTEQAQRRGERFVRAHPDGPFTERVRRAIDAP